MNVKHRNCARPGCYTRPAFNFPGEGKGQYCNKHKVDNVLFLLVLALDAWLLLQQSAYEQAKAAPFLIFPRGVAAGGWHDQR